MSTKAGQVQPKDVKQGKVFWRVNYLPDDDSKTILPKERYFAERVVIQSQAYNQQQQNSVGKIVVVDIERLHQGVREIRPQMIQPTRNDTLYYSASPYGKMFITKKAADRWIANYAISIFNYANQTPSIIVLARMKEEFPTPRYRKHRKPQWRSKSIKRVFRHWPKYTTDDHGKRVPWVIRETLVDDAELAQMRKTFMDYHRDPFPDVTNKMNNWLPAKLFGKDIPVDRLPSGLVTFLEDNIRNRVKAKARIMLEKKNILDMDLRLVPEIQFEPMMQNGQVVAYSIVDPGPPRKKEEEM